jgi:hypothetical protein
MKRECKLKYRLDSTCNQSYVQDVPRDSKIIARVRKCYDREFCEAELMAAELHTPGLHVPSQLPRFHRLSISPISSGHASRCVT